MAEKIGVKRTANLPAFPGVTTFNQPSGTKESVYREMSELKESLLGTMDETQTNEYHTFDGFSSYNGKLNVDNEHNWKIRQKREQEHRQLTNDLVQTWENSAFGTDSAATDEMRSYAAKELDSFYDSHKHGDPTPTDFSRIRETTTKSLVESGWTPKGMPKPYTMDDFKKTAWSTASTATNLAKNAVTAYSLLSAAGVPVSSFLPFR